MRDNPLRRLQAFGQSVWLDHFDRRMLYTGELAGLIENDGLRGVSSDPAIFDKAVVESADYDETIQAMAWRGRGISEIHEALMVEDARMAAELFRDLHEESAGRYGFVSLEVNPHLARDVDGTINEARQLWAALDCPNAFIAVPATEEGLPAIEQLIADGINVNVTMLFGLERYRRVADAYIAGLERLAAGGRSPRVASVAGFFPSRIDVLVDARLEEVMRENGTRGKQAAALRGQIAIAGAKRAYELYKQTFTADRFLKLAMQGARPQSLLWKSTGADNPRYSEIRYVEPLIGPDTISAMPPRTLRAYRQYGRPAARLEDGLVAAGRKLRQLAALGIELEQMARQLEEEGIDQLVRPYDNSLWTLRHKAIALREPVA
jgi:transaldolase